MPGLRKVGQENFHSKQLKLKSKTLQLRKEEEVENKKENKVGKKEERRRGGGGRASFSYT